MTFSFRSISFRFLLIGAAAAFLFAVRGGWAQEDDSLAGSPFGETEKTAAAAENAPAAEKSGVQAADKADANSPFAGNDDRFRKAKNSPALFFKNSKGEEIPIVDDAGRVVFRRPEDKPLDEMTEDDFYKTLLPAEKAVVQPEPKTAVELIRAAVWISRFGRKPFAKILLEKSFAAEAADAELSALVDDLGADKLFQFAADEENGPRAAEAYDRIMTGTKKYWESPEAVKSAFDRTLHGSEEDRMQAVLDLRKGGAAAFDTVLAGLFSDNPDASAMASEVLNHLGNYAKEGLLALLAADDEAHLIRIAETLAQTPDLPEIYPLLFRYYDSTLSDDVRQALGGAIAAQIGDVPEAEKASEQAAELGRRYWERKVPLLSTESDTQEIWQYNPEKKNLDRFTLSNEAYYRYQAARLLTGAARLDRDNSERIADAAAALAEAVLYDAGLDQTPNTERFTEIMGDLSSQELASAVEMSLSSGHFKGGVIPAVLLGKKAQNGEKFAADSSEAAVLVRAAASSDRRLRFAALTALDLFDLPMSYPGSGSVTNALLHFCSASGKRFTVVGGGKISNGGIIGSAFSDGTVRVMPVTSGGDLIRSAQENADVEYVIAVSYLRNPDPWTICQTLAADYRTADIPVYVGIDDETYLEQAQWYAGNEPNAVALPIPSDQETGRWALDQLYQKVKPEQVPVNVRLAQAKQAVLMLARRLGENQTFCEPQVVEKIAVDFLYRPEIRTEAITFALGVRSEQVQRNMADFAGDARLPNEARQAFLTALDQHIERYGLLIRGPEIRRFYDEYNASESLSAQEQKFLSQRLDILERKGSKEKDDADK